MLTVTSDMLPSAVSAVRDILYLYVDMIKSYGGFGHNLDVGTFDALEYLDAEVDEPAGCTFALDVQLLHAGSGVALLCALSDAWDDFEAIDREWPLFSRIHDAFTARRFARLPVIEKAVDAAFRDEKEFRALLPIVYQESVQAYFRRLAGPG